MTPYLAASVLISIKVFNFINCQLTCPLPDYVKLNAGDFDMSFSMDSKNSWILTTPVSKPSFASTYWGLFICKNYPDICFSSQCVNGAWQSGNLTEFKCVSNQVSNCDQNGISTTTTTTTTTTAPYCWSGASILNEPGVTLETSSDCSLWFTEVSTSVTILVGGCVKVTCENGQIFKSKCVSDHLFDPVLDSSWTCTSVATTSLTTVGSAVTTVAPTTAKASQTSAASAANTAAPTTAKALQTSAASAANTAAPTTAKAALTSAASAANTEASATAKVTSVIASSSTRTLSILTSTAISAPASTTVPNSQPSTTTSITTSTTTSITGKALIDGQAKIDSVKQLPSQTIQSQAFPDSISDLNLANETAADILKECDHFLPNRAAPPPSSAGPVTMVTPTFGVDRLLEISTIDETISVSATLLLTWSVTTCPVNSQDILTRKPASFNQLYIGSAREVWTPGYRYISAATSNIYMQSTDKYGEDLLATIQSDALNSPNKTLQFYWVKDGAFTSACSLELSKFPFDKQTCMFAFALMRSTQVVQYQQAAFYFPSAMEHEEWSFTEQSTAIAEIRYKGQAVSTVFYTVTLTRKPTYYILNLVLPTVVLVIVEIASFILPPKEITRSCISVTVLLAVTLAQSSVISQLPKTSRHVLLADYTFGLAILCAACALEQMSVCWLAARELQNSSLPPSHSSGGSNQTSSKNCLRRIGIIRSCDIISAGLAVLVFLAIHSYAAASIFS